jgi:hypothetical protein
VLCMSQVWALCKSMFEQEKRGKRDTVRGSCVDKGSKFSKKFEQSELLLVSQTTLGTISTSAWLIDSGATCHMIGA